MHLHKGTSVMKKGQMEVFECTFPTLGDGKGSLVEFLPPHPLRSWGTVELKCEEEYVENTKAYLKGKGYCWQLDKNPTTGIHIFSVFVITNLTTGEVEPA